MTELLGVVDALQGGSADTALRSRPREIDAEAVALRERLATHSGMASDFINDLRGSWRTSAGRRHC